jgi:hypothetical protein
MFLVVFHSVATVVGVVTEIIVEMELHSTPVVIVPTLVVIKPMLVVIVPARVVIIVERARVGLVVAARVAGQLVAVELAFHLFLQYV